MSNDVRCHPRSHAQQTKAYRLVACFSSDPADHQHDMITTLQPFHHSFSNIYICSTSILLTWHQDKQARTLLCNQWREASGSLDICLTTLHLVNAGPACLHRVPNAVLDGACILLEHALSPLVDGVILLEELLVADGSCPLHTHSHSWSATMLCLEAAKCFIQAADASVIALLVTQTPCIHACTRLMSRRHCKGKVMAQQKPEVLLIKNCRIRLLIVR